MGQSVVTVMYGIKSTKDLFTENGSPFWSDYEQPEDKRLEYDDSPHDAYEGDAVGFSVAASGGCNDDEDYLGDSCLLADFEKKHAKSIARAKKRWHKFSAWALKVHDRKLPPAALWITTDERG